MIKLTLLIFCTDHAQIFADSSTYKVQIYWVQVLFQKKKFIHKLKIVKRNSNYCFRHEIKYLLSRKNSSFFSRKLIFRRKLNYYSTDERTRKLILGNSSKSIKETKKLSLT